MTALPYWSAEQNFNSMWLPHVWHLLSLAVVSAVGEGRLRGASSGPDQGPSNLVGGSLTNLRTGRMRRGQLEMGNGNARDRAW